MERVHIVSANYKHSVLVGEALGYHRKQVCHYPPFYRLRGIDRDTPIFVYETFERFTERELVEMEAALAPFSDVRFIDEWFIGGPTREERREYERQKFLEQQGFLLEEPESGLYKPTKKLFPYI